MVPNYIIISTEADNTNRFSLVAYDTNYFLNVMGKDLLTKLYVKRKKNNTKTFLYLPSTFSLPARENYKVLPLLLAFLLCILRLIIGNKFIFCCFITTFSSSLPKNVL